MNQPSKIGKIEQDKRNAYDDLIKTLPARATKPRGYPTLETNMMTANVLQHTVNTDEAWEHSAAYAELIFRILTQDKPEVMNVPDWKRTQR